jgi:hypothetical protein
VLKIKNLGLYQDFNNVLTVEQYFGKELIKENLPRFLQNVEGSQS